MTKNMTTFASFAAPCLRISSILRLSFYGRSNGCSCECLSQTKNALTPILRGAQFPAWVIPVRSAERSPSPVVPEVPWTTPYIYLAALSKNHHHSKHSDSSVYLQVTPSPTCRYKTYHKQEPNRVNQDAAYIPIHTSKVPLRWNR